MTRPASIVLPRPTSSAISRLARAISMARTSGSSWKSSMLTPLRKGACRNPRSAFVAAPHLTASRNASSRFGVVSAGDRRKPGSFDDVRARLDFPDDFDLLAEAVFVDRRQRNEMLRSGVSVTGGRSLHVGDYPLPAPHLDELTRLGRRHDRHNFGTLDRATCSGALMRLRFQRRVQIVDVTYDAFPDRFAELDRNGVSDETADRLDDRSARLWPRICSSLGKL